MSIGAKGKMLAMEISHHLIRVAEIVPDASPVQVTRAATMERPGGEPASVGQAIRAFLLENGFTAKRALVSYSGPLIEHRIYALPPAAREAREELLRGKVASEVATPIAEMRVSGEVVGKVMEGGVERQEVLTAFTPEFEIRRLTFLLVEAGVSPARVASVPLALAALHPADQKDLLAGFVHYEPGRCIIGISDGGKLRFSREFALEAPPRPAAAAEVPEYRIIDVGGDQPGAEPAPGPTEEEAIAERLATELTRSLLYFRQLSRGGSIAKLYWSGLAPSPEIIRVIGQRLKLEISPHPAIAAAAHAEGLPWGGAEFAVPIGLAAAGQVPEQVNLLPEGYIRKRKRRRGYTAIAVVLAVFVAANVALFAGLQSARNQYRDVLQGVAASANRQAGMREGFSRWLALRKAVDEARAAEGELSPLFTRWKAMFASLGAPVPAEMAFASLSIERLGAGYRGELRGKARGKNPSEAQEKINAFLAAVRRSGTAAEAQYVPLEVRPLRGEEGKGYEQEFLVTFLLRQDKERDVR